MCNLDIEDDTVSVSSVIFYNKNEDEYFALEDSKGGLCHKWK